MINVLYVDDEEFNLIVFKHSFKKDIHVITAASAVEALKIIESYKEIDVVVSDMKMPDMNGIEFIKKAKSELPDIPYFILTGFDVNNEIDDAMKSHLISNYFSKPMDIDAIETTIRSTVN